VHGRIPEEGLKMLTDAFNKGDRPEVKTYHIHIYYEVGKETESQAKALAKQIARLFPEHVEAVHEYDKPGGPHAVSNVAVYLKGEGFGNIVSWLQFNSGDLSALVHPKSGDVIKDHIDYGLWLGPRREGLLSDIYFEKKRRERSEKPGIPKP
jgi:aromatic ring-cleaving dioxygenase